MISFAILGAACGGNVAPRNSEPLPVGGSGGTTNGTTSPSDADANAGNGLQLTSISQAEMLDWFTSSGCVGRFLVGVDRSSHSSTDSSAYCRFTLYESDLLEVPDGGILGQVCAFAYPATSSSVQHTVNKTSLVYQTGDSTAKLYLINFTVTPCNPAGWYLDSNGQITLCPITCAAICEDPSATIYGRLGCGGPVIQ